MDKKGKYYKWFIMALSAGIVFFVFYIIALVLLYKNSYSNFDLGSFWGGIIGGLLTLIGVGSTLLFHTINDRKSLMPVFNIEATFLDTEEPPDKSKYDQYIGLSLKKEIGISEKFEYRRFEIKISNDSNNNARNITLLTDILNCGAKMSQREAEVELIKKDSFINILLEVKIPEIILISCTSNYITCFFDFEYSNENYRYHYEQKLSTRLVFIGEYANVNRIQINSPA